MEPPGVNLVGHLEAELGIGEVARQLVGALDAADVPVLPISIEATASRQGHPFPHATPPIAAFPTTLLCVNADQVPRVLPRLGERALADRRTVGLWWWEVPILPSWLADSALLLDEVWAGSSWLTQVFTDALSVPVRHLPMPVAEPRRPLALSREALGLPRGFLFSFIFDHNSVLERKNPLGLIQAYRRAFPEPNGTALALKSINGSTHSEQHEAVVRAAADRSDIVVVDGYLDADAQAAWMAACDCYVSLHRAEGFGFTLAEAMLRNKPVIATGWSGNADFTRPDTAFVVDHRLVAVGPGNEPYPADAEWAEPDLDHAAALMRRALEGPDEAKRIARAGQTFIREHHSPAAVGRAIAERATAIGSPEAPPARAAAFALVSELRSRRDDDRERAAAGRVRRTRTSIATVSDVDDVGEIGRALDVTRAQVEALDGDLAAAERLLADAERRAASIHVVELERDEARIEADELAARVKSLEDLVERSRRVHEDMLGSTSWRVTRPLRVAQTWVRRRRG